VYASGLAERVPAPGHDSGGALAVPVPGVGGPVGAVAAGVLAAREHLDGQ